MRTALRALVRDGCEWSGAQGYVSLALRGGAKRASSTCDVVEVRAGQLIDTSMRRAMQPETLSGYVLASQYKKNFLKGRTVIGDEIS